MQAQQQLVVDFTFGLVAGRSPFVLIRLLSGGRVPQVGVHAVDNIIIALGVLSVPRRLLPLDVLSRIRYFIHACGTACGIHYVVRLACRLGVSWASDRWVQLHAAAVASGLLVCHAKLPREQTWYILSLVAVA